MMGWLVAVAVALLVAVIWLGVSVLSALERLRYQVAWLRREMTTGLGVSSSEIDGYATGGWLEELAKDVRERRKAERKERYAKDAEF